MSRNIEEDDVRPGDLTFRDIGDRAEAGWLAIVPTGCAEQQGPHLPVDFDTWFVETVWVAAAREAAERYGVNALVLPTMPFGPTPEYRSYAGGYIPALKNFTSPSSRAYWGPSLSKAFGALHYGGVAYRTP